MIASYVATMHGSLSRQETSVATEVLLYYYFYSVINIILYTEGYSHKILSLISA